MKYAVVKINGFQHKVQEGEEIETSRLAFKEGEEIEFPEVLLLVEGEKVKIGKPILKGVKAKGKVKKHFLGEKLDIYKFRAKTGYRRKMGFRPQKTMVVIDRIVTSES